MDYMREQYAALDRSNQGHVQFNDIRQLLESVGEQPTDEKMEQIREMFESKGIRRYDVKAALLSWSYLKELNLREEDEMDHDIRNFYSVNAFVAMGGNADGTGFVTKKKLRDIITVIFELNVDIDGMLEEAQLDIDDDLNFYQFTCLLEAGGPERISRFSSLLAAPLMSNNMF